MRRAVLGHLGIATEENEKGGRGAAPCFSNFAKPSVDGDGRPGGEHEAGLGREYNFLFAGGRSASRARSSSRQSADGRAFAAPGEAADERTRACTPPDEDGVMLGF